MIGKDYFNSRFSINGLQAPKIFARVNTEIDLQKWNRAFGVKSVDLKGRYALHLLADGIYSTGLQKRGLTACGYRGDQYPEIQFEVHF